MLPKRILQDVPRGNESLLVVPQHALESISLPQHVPELLLVVVTGALLCTRNESESVGRVRLPLYEEVEMIRHEAVRNDFKPLVSCSSKNLRQYDLDAARFNERVCSLIRAKRQSIPVETDVVEGFQVAGRSGEHAGDMASALPGRQETTSSG